MIVRLAFAALFCASLLAQPRPSAGDWPVSTPEQQGLDSNKLADAVEFVLRENIHIHSLLVIRNGALVVDVTFYPFPLASRHDVASVTKSVTSTLIGIAVDRGLIPDVAQPVLGVFADREAADLDERKKAMTLEHLLLMQSGLACVNSPTEETLSRMMGSRDWVRFMLDLPMSEPPGTRFVYNSGAVHLLSAIIRKRSGMTAIEFARRHLFEPLGITDVVWPLDPRGEDNHGWGDLQLRPHDMAKLGALFLNKGIWQGRRILSARWVEEATRRHITLGSGEGYGYLWWMPAKPAGLVEARGRGGQRIIIWSENNMVIVFTGGGFEPGRVGSFIIEAVKSDQALAPNPAGAARLEDLIRRAAAPPPAAGMTGRELPEAARIISGKRFVLEPNPRDLQDFVLTFNDPEEAVLSLGLASGSADRLKLEFRLGLDGLPRLTPGRFGLPAACRGTWTKPDAFVIEIDEVGNINRFSLELTFRDGRVSGTLAEKTGLGSIPLKGEMKEAAERAGKDPASLP